MSQRLFQAVILRALMDLNCRFNKVQAEHWIFSSKDFYLICDCAGWNPGEIRKFAKRVITEDIKFIAPPTKGDRYMERKLKREKDKQDGAIPTLSLCMPHSTIPKD